MELFQQFLNRVNRGYGQVDKNVFGGLLPGGAATPIGAAFQNVTLPKPLPATTRRMASLVDATAGAIAGAQPVIEKAVKAVPEPVQSVIASGLNALPFSANLFSRYYTGLGNKNLEIPEEATKGIKTMLDTFPKFKNQLSNQLTFQLENSTEMLNAVKTGTLKPVPGAFTPDTQTLNNAIAALKSNLNRVQKGDIPFDTYQTTNKNPLTSPATSFGQLWFSPTDTGYQAKERYDFSYGGADQKEQYPTPGVQLTPSQMKSIDVARNPAIPSKFAGAHTAPITNFGRAVVSKMPDKFFEYLINLR